MSTFRLTFFDKGINWKRPWVSVTYQLALFSSAQTLLCPLLPLFVTLRLSTGVKPVFIADDEKWLALLSLTSVAPSLKLLVLCSDATVLAPFADNALEETDPKIVNIGTVRAVRRWRSSKKI